LSNFVFFEHIYTLPEGVCMIFENFIVFMNKILFFSSFVNNTSGFPKPLSLEEEKECFEKFKKGDKQARDKLINHNLRLVAHIVKKYSGSSEADDLISVGSIGLIKAINSFEYGKGTQLSTYAARCIENEILMLLRMSKKHNKIMSIQDSLGQDKDGNEVDLMDVISEINEDFIVENVSNSILSDKISVIIKQNLPQREAQIIRYRYGLENHPILTQREIAKKLGISRSYISRLETKALATIKQKMQEQKIFKD
jgi:RNA polymerase sporulation-specific sigma factor